jgi:predicted ATP-grasp superfamily ATP-dependent carboligase
MRLLVTNPWNGQAYCVLRALRPHAARVIVTAYREHGVLGRLAPAAVSRFADAVYRVPFAAQDWQRGRIHDENSEAEEAYVRAVLDICVREDIDTVFPSWDPEVLILSKNKQRFADRGIAVPVPEWLLLRQVMDKYALAQLATEMGCPCPRTHLPRSLAEAAEVAELVGFPLLLKPRCSSGSRGVRLVVRREQLADAIRRVERTFGMPILQEWIPGRLDRRVNVHATMDRQGRLVAVAVRRNVRSVFASFDSVTTTQASLEAPALVAQVGRLLERLGYAGCVSAQFKVDPRDGLAKLLEINCRPGYRVWCNIATGQNTPSLCVQIERGESVEALPPQAGSLVFLSPIEDALAFGVSLLDWASRRVAPRRDGELLGAPPPLRDIVRGYRDTYLAPGRFFDLYFKALADDPLAGLAWYASHLIRILRGPKRMPR